MIGQVSTNGVDPALKAALAGLDRNDLALLLTVDQRRSWDEPESPLRVAARDLLYEVDVEEPRTERRMVAIQRALTEHTAPPTPLYADVEPPKLLYRTLADISDDPPGALLLGMFEPDGPNLAYAAPGVGKGTTGAWVIVELQRLGMTVAIFDAERRPKEWARRVAGLGGDRSKVVYLGPEDLGRSYVGRPLWDAAPALDAYMKSSGADLLIVDSVLPAIGVGEERLRSDAKAPYLFVQALDALGKPSLSLGHPPKGQPEGEPFGSMGWVAAMRMTWLGTRGEGEAHAVRWRPRKRNERGYVAGVLLTVEYGEDGRPARVSREDDEEQTRERLLYMLQPGPRTVADMAEEMLADSDEPATEEQRKRLEWRLRRALDRLKRDGSVEPDKAGGRGVRWSLRWEA